MIGECLTVNDSIGGVLVSLEKLALVFLVGLGRISHLAINRSLFVSCFLKEKSWKLREYFQGFQLQVLLAQRQLLDSLARSLLVIS